MSVGKVWKNRADILGVLCIENLQFLFYKVYAIGNIVEMISGIYVWRSSDLVE